jgi:hypothetical protein
MSGERVAGAANALSLKGLLATEVDGMFSAATRQALLVFQAFGGLQVSARADGNPSHLGLLPDEACHCHRSHQRHRGNLIRQVNEYLTGISAHPTSERALTRPPTSLPRRCHVLHLVGAHRAGAGYDPATFADRLEDGVLALSRLAALDISSPAGGR